MEKSYELLKLILDSITEHIVLIDESGKILFVNKSWSKFGDDNACVLGDSDGWNSVNYLEECDKAAATGDEFATKAGAGIRSVINNKNNSYYLEYPCHSEEEDRWFMMRVTPSEASGKNYFVITHQNITERKLAEEKLQKIAQLDGLTNIANRRTFDEFLREEWRRCSRPKKPISLAIVDLDHFKFLNDDYGHQTGDECLVKVASVLKEFANRPSDICARYGGEEFVLVWGGVPLEQAKQLSKQLLKKIEDLNIPNKNSPVANHLTASIGLAEMTPTGANEETKLICLADSMLYKAKDNGRNRIES